MDAISYLRGDMQWAHELLGMVAADVTPEQAHWAPPGIANPIGALYAHAVCGEDGIVNGMLRGTEPLFASTWAGKAGVEKPQIGLEFDWARALKIDLAAFRRYAQAVYATTDEYLASLTEDDLSRQLDLSRNGFGHKPVGWVLSALVISHINNMTGEISALKGIQGAKGYPF